MITGIRENKTLVINHMSALKTKIQDIIKNYIDKI